MNEYETLSSLKILALYSQVSLFDAKTKDAYPQWKTGEEAVAFGRHGAVVSVANDQEVQVFVCKGKGTPESKLCVSGEIEVLSDNIAVGNVPAAQVAYLPIQSGRYSVIIYTDGIGIEAKKVYFFLEYITGLS
jgi:hypothetical protein